MKKINLILLFLIPLAWIISGCYTGQVAQDNGANNNTNNTQYNTPDNNSGYDEYNVDDLNQYGDWVNVNQYGRVWQPSVVNNWQPFTNGHWAFDGNDWVWVSYEPFGWIVYHYGSWEFSPTYGWLWIPARDQWSPARVQWVDYGDNVCWAPLRYNNQNWSEPWENNNIHPWMVVKMQDFNRENISTYRENNISRVIANNNQVQIERRQPDVKVVQRYVREPIPIVKIVREPVSNQTPPVKTTNPPVRTNNPPVVKDNPPVRNDNPPVGNDNPPVRTTTPPVRNDAPPVRTNTPPVTSRSTTTVRTQNDRNIIHMQVPPTEKQKVDKYSPQVQRNALIKKNPRKTVNPVPKTEDKKTGNENK
jgi:hypothetical protein